MPLKQAERELAAGKLIREERDAHERRAFLDAELSDTATAFRRAATQIECLLADSRSSLSPALSKINMKHILAVLAEREVLQRKISAAHTELQRLRAEDR